MSARRFAIGFGAVVLALSVGVFPAVASAQTTRATATVGVARDAAPVGKPIQIAGGHEDNCAVLNTHTVECWGGNFNGQLGDGRRPDSTQPVAVVEISRVRQVAVGYAHACALIATGNVGCWGWNDYGQLGNGHVTSTSRPVPVLGLSRVRQITAGFESSCALLVTGSVWCWGWNSYGQLGDGGLSPKYYPVRVRGLTGVRQISAGYGHTCATLANGTVRCWGLNQDGQLGDGTLHSSQRPMEVAGLTGVRSVEAGFHDTCAVLTDGGARCWGWNGFGQLGDGSRVSTTRPVAVRGISDAIEIGTSYGHTCALTRTHLVRCWGWNGFGQLGTGSLRSLTVPVPTRYLSEVLQISVGDDDVCALLRIHAVTCWGSNIKGELGFAGRGRALVPRVTPLSPMRLVGLPRRHMIVLSWHPPRFNGGTRILGYTATSRDRRYVCVTTHYVCVLRGVPDGVHYLFSVAAANAIGRGRPSAPRGVFPAFPPAAPSAIAQPGNAEVEVTWTPPDNGGLAILTYEAVVEPGGESCVVRVHFCLITGLTNGQPYSVRVFAKNRLGQGVSPPYTFRPIADLPGQPTGVTATPGDASAAVTWSAPSANGGSPIVGYTVTAIDATNPASPHEGCAWTSGPLTCTVTSLTNGDSYTFTVTATNSTNTHPGAGSSPSNAIVPATTPSAPTAVTASAGVASASVSWTAPANNGSAITEYEVTAVDSTNAGNGGQTCTTTGALQCTVTGLVEGDTYTFTVAAKNADGFGSASSPSNAVALASKPGAPTGVTANAGDATATVTWSAAASGGSTITTYAVKAADSTTSGNGGQTCTWTFGPLTCSFSGLTNGDSYTFTIVATNAIGAGPASSPSNAVTPGGLPGAPTGVSASAGDASANVSWNAAASNGSAISGYTVTAADSTTSGNGGQTCTTTGGLSCTVSGLTNGDSYTFTVVAANGAGSGNASAPSPPVTPVAPATAPGAPQNVVATPGNASASVVWTAPLSDGGSPITQYTVAAADSTTPSNGNESCTTPDGVTLTCTVIGLTTGDTYTFTVDATNAIGTGPFSDPSPAVVSLTARGGPDAVARGASLVQAHLGTAPTRTGAR